MHVLAHAGGHTPVQNIVETLFLLGGMGLAWAAFGLRNVRLSGRPVLSWAVALIAIAVLELSFVLPAQLGVKIAKVRPTTSAKIIILSPAPGQVLRGNPATVRVRLRVTGARIVTQTSSHLSPHTGHIHLYLDGVLAAMQYQASTTIDGTPGSHLLKAELVAVDHGPFNPPVTASVTFRVIP
ncbi:MAG TPA: hypothetical protein VH642_09100 [Streptosporangiaceae bacterium]